MKTLKDVADQFAIYGEFEGAEPFGRGHINATFVSRWNQAGAPVRYLHQKINDRVFPQPGEVMENIDRVTRHIAALLQKEGEGDISRKTMTVVPAKDGKLFVRDKEGGWWRTYLFIEGTRVLDEASSVCDVRLLGRTVGRFQKQLSGLGGKRLHETIPGFHDMENRYRLFYEAVSRDPVNRVKDTADEIAFMRENEEQGKVLVHALRTGRIPERICHNDAKMNNILMDDGGKGPLCVVDLDTVMPGSILFDFGDLVRTAASTAREDETDLSKVKFSLSSYEALLEGYLSEASSFLTAEEKGLLAEAGRNITHIMAVRFLTDYLEGDVYYRILRPGHNIERCRNQIALIKSMDGQRDKAVKKNR
ncbi:MAG: aminoglycoside phosphotransferase family protein [Treponema sp.]|nr:aminoglycoside phosphotransferase family protein [Treponema sp.]